MRREARGARREARTPQGGPLSMANKSMRSMMWDLLTFDRLITGPVVHLIYWAGLGVISLVAFSSVGAAVGVALRETAILGKILAIPVAVAGLLVAGALVLLWRALCEFYVAIFRISDDLRALRLQVETERADQRPTRKP